MMERTYNVPLRRSFRSAPKYKRAKKAIGALRAFLTQHMGTDDIRIGKQLNEKIWERGIKNPPHHVKVTAVRDDEDVCKVELEGVVYAEPIKAEAKKEQPETLKEKLQSKLAPGAKSDAGADTAKSESADAKKEDASPEAKPAAKKEVKSPVAGASSTKKKE
ncbi:MAG: 60S ribosomal protein L31 [Candidatus Woesearchaeota archaeon]|nr:MAG: 60S ribosomal protein L31 [Candidatus Woesearchaeota archaeon]